MMASDVVYVESPKGMYRITKSWTGDVGQYLLAVGQKSIVYAKAEAPGTMKAKLDTKRDRAIGGDLELHVRANHKAATMQHEGTPPHMIYPRRASMLRFYWAKAGRVVAFAHVSHPGTRANPFLWRAVKRALSMGVDVRQRIRL